MATRDPRSSQSRPRRPYEEELRRQHNQRPNSPRYQQTSRKKKRRRKKSHAGRWILLILILLILAAAAYYVISSGILNREPEGVEVQKPVPEKPQVISTATLGATGDILLHMPIVNTYATGDGYDFTPVFSVVAPVYQQTDLMVANLEVTLGGEESGEYSGYPGFNSPDAIVPALRNAGVDICLTANNHSNDTGYYGMMRTLDVLTDYGMEYLGTRRSTDEKYLMLKNVNGVRLGMICYTYDTREYTEWEKSLNGGYLSDDAIQSINTFSNAALDEFYADIQQQVYYMDMLNVDAKVVFLHWGTEYQDDPNETQTEIAQRLCDMGVDVIIGGHPHVIQRFDTLTSADGHETICLYSMGNELSNQRTDIMLDEDGGRGYTEDGLVIQVSFEKFNNGKVKVGGVNIIPTWVELDGWGYTIMSLTETSDPLSWGATDTNAAIASYNRTMGRLSEAYPAYRAKKNQSEVISYIE